MKIWTCLGLGLLAPKGEGDGGGGGGAPAGGSGDGATAPPLAGGEGTPPDPPPASAKNEPPPPAGKGGGEPAPIQMTQEQLNDRLARASKSQLKKMFGTDDVEAITSRWSKLDELEKAEEERKRAEMTEIERYKADVEAEKARANQTQAELDEMKFNAHVSGICVKHGIKNLEYAKYIVAQAADALPEGEELDADEFLKEKLADSQYQAALGIQGEARPAPVSSSPEPGQPPPPPPPANPGGGGRKEVKDMSRTEFQAHLASLGVGQAGT